MPEFEFLLNLRESATPAQPERKQSNFEILIRHLLARLCQNELVSIDGDISRAMQTAGTAAIPQVFVALLLFPIYHRLLKPRTYWPQAGDHLFFVVYALFVMGTVTLYSWDLLFPDVVDIFVMGTLPIPAQTLLFTRIVAVTIFLLAALIGTSFLGAVLMPLVADQPNLQWQLLAHFTAVFAAGGFAAGTILAVQGILLITFTERMFQRITPILQTIGMLLLFTMLFAFPHMVANLQRIASQPSAKYIPPLWFLGLYERIMHGGATPASFNILALRGISATAIVLAITCITYPIAYRRKVKLAMEGTFQQIHGRRLLATLSGYLLSFVCPNPRQRGIWCFISQTLWRSRRPRTMMAIFLSVGAALAIVRLAPINLYTIQLALFTITFFTLCGLRAAFASPVDLSGTWIFRSILGRETDEVLDMEKRWAVTNIFTLNAILVFVIATARLIPFAAIIPTLFVLAAFTLVITDFYGLYATAMPFTQAKKVTHSERPLAAIRYLIVFPFLLGWMPLWMSMPWIRLILFAIIVWIIHLFLIHSTHRQRENDFKGNLDESDPDAFPTSLGLRE